jgi:AcrR family transcriptional regulator
VSPEQIEREAVRLFSEKTYPMVGMRDISDAVGLLPGSLYVHISSKEDLLFKICERGIKTYIELLTPIAESDKPASARLTEIVLTYMHVLENSLELIRVAVTQWIYLGDANRENILRLRTQLQELVAKVIDDGVESGEFTSVRHSNIVVMSVIGLLNSTLTWYSPERSLAPAVIGQQLSDLVISGLTG